MNKEELREEQGIFEKKIKTEAKPKPQVIRVMIPCEGCFEYFSWDPKIVQQDGNVQSILCHACLRSMNSNKSA